MGFLDAIRVDRETAHSRLLAWLLDPRKDHQLGVAFLRRFLKLAVGDARAAVTSTTVSPEDRQDESRADFTLTTNTRYVLVENKIHWEAFQRSQIDRHARGGRRRAKRLGKEHFHLVLVVPDKRRHSGDIKVLQHKYHPSIIEWSDVARIARHTADSVGHAASGGKAFLEAYADYIERAILGQWKGFNMSVMTDQVVSAGATYIAAKDALLKDMRQFCACVQAGLGPALTTAPKQKTEVFDGERVYFLMNEYYFGSSLNSVTVSFGAKTGAKSLKSIRLAVDFETSDTKVISRVRKHELRTYASVGKYFGPRTFAYFGDDAIQVWEFIPAKLWQSDDTAGAEKAVKYTQKVLIRFLQGAKKLVK